MTWPESMFYCVVVLALSPIIILVLGCVFGIIVIIFALILMWVHDVFEWVSKKYLGRVNP